MTAEHVDETESVRRVFPSLTEGELSEAVMQLREYFKIAAEICSQDDGKSSLIDQIDRSDRFSTMEERSNDSLKT